MIGQSTDKVIPRKRATEKEGRSRKKKKQTSEDEYMVEQPQIHEEEISTPEYRPPAFSSEDEDISEDEGAVPIQSHANIDLVTFDALNSNTVQNLIQERDRLEFGNLRQRHTLLHQIDQTQWPVLFQLLPLLLFWECIFLTTWS